MPYVYGRVIGGCGFVAIGYWLLVIGYWYYSEINWRVYLHSNQ